MLQGKQACTGAWTKCCWVQPLVQGGAVVLLGICSSRDCYKDPSMYGLVCLFMFRSHLPCVLQSPSEGHLLHLEQRHGTASKHTGNQGLSSCTGARACRRLLTDDDPALRDRLIQVLFQGGKFQWARLTNLIQLAREGSGASTVAAATSNGNGFSNGNGVSSSNGSSPAGTALVRAPQKGLDLSDTVRDAARLLLLDEKLRRQVIMALTEDNQLHVAEVRQVLALLQNDVSPGRVVQQVVTDLPSIGRQVMLSWADKVLVS
eukprot:GHUV01028924.1.p1 GENE.GHUV01028924.1~~GHUV01028924.1.p1  ORF type:complete len:261 (+),score=63.34 GHUV01028924.1:463-1245(+)